MGRLVGGGGKGGRAELEESAGGERDVGLKSCTRLTRVGVMRCGCGVVVFAQHQMSTGA